MLVPLHLEGEGWSVLAAGPRGQREGATPRYPGQASECPHQDHVSVDGSLSHWGPERNASPLVPPAALQRRGRRRGRRRRRRWEKNVVAVEEK